MKIKSPQSHYDVKQPKYPSLACVWLKINSIRGHGKGGRLFIGVLRRKQTKGLEIYDSAF